MFMRILFAVWTESVHEIKLRIDSILLSGFILKRHFCLVIKMFIVVLMILSCGLYRLFWNEIINIIFVEGCFL